jgi:hypothetical protein
MAKKAAVMDCILTVRSEVKIEFGANESVAAHVPGLWQAMDKEGEGFADLGQTFPKTNEANLKEDGIFVGAQLQQQIADQGFRTKLNEMLPQEDYGRHLKTSARGLLDNENAKHCSDIVLEPISSYRESHVL